MKLFTKYNFSRIIIEITQPANETNNEPKISKGKCKPQNTLERQPMTESKNSTIPPTLDSLQ